MASTIYRDFTLLTRWPIGWSIWLFSLTRFHAYIVFGLAYLYRIIFCAGLLLIATLLATVRLFTLYVLQ